MGTPTLLHPCRFRRSGTDGVVPTHPPRSFSRLESRGSTLSEIREAGRIHRTTLPDPFSLSLQQTYRGMTVSGFEAATVGVGQR